MTRPGCRWLACSAREPAGSGSLQERNGTGVLLAQLWGSALSCSWTPQPRDSLQNLSRRQSAFSWVDGQVPLATFHPPGYPREHTDPGGERGGDRAKQHCLCHGWGSIRGEWQKSQLQGTSRGIPPNFCLKLSSSLHEGRTWLCLAQS